MRVAYLSTVGMTPEAVANSFWCAVREERLDVARVYLLCSRGDVKRGIEGSSGVFDEVRRRVLEIARRNLGLSLKEEDVERIEVSQEDVRVVYSEIEELYRRVGKEYEVCVDVTGGRKTMSGGALLAARDLGLRCYYLWVYNPSKCRGKSLDQMVEGRDYELVRLHELWR